MKLTEYTQKGRTYRRTDGGVIIGPKMDLAIRRVVNNEYSARLPLANAIGPHGSTDYGYRIINRCSRFITTDSEHPAASPHGFGTPVLTDAGREYMDAR